MQTPDDNNTLDNAGEAGRELADTLAGKVIEAIKGYPAMAGSNHTAAEQTAAIMRITADTIYRAAEEIE